MSFFYSLHMLHRCWRYRLSSEKESVNFLLNQNLSGTTAIDVGANRGIYTYWMSKKVGKNGAVISFEPQPELIAPMKSFLNVMRINNVSIINKGLSDNNSILELRREKVGCGGASFEYHSGDREGVSVGVVRMDDYLKEFPVSTPISFIKVDVEGHELNMFKGARETILKHKPILLFECHHNEAESGELFMFLKDCGYNGFFFSGDEKIPYTEFNKYPYRKKTESHRNYVFMYEDNQSVNVA